jgi:hypothetical protein
MANDNDNQSTETFAVPPSQELLGTAPKTLLARLATQLGGWAIGINQDAGAGEDGEPAPYAHPDAGYLSDEMRKLSDMAAAALYELELDEQDAPKTEDDLAEGLAKLDAKMDRQNEKLGALVLRENTGDPVDPNAQEDALYGAMKRVLEEADISLRMTTG